MEKAIFECFDLEEIPDIQSGQAKYQAAVKNCKFAVLKKIPADISDPNDIECIMQVMKKNNVATNYTLSLLFFLERQRSLNLTDLEISEKTGIPVKEIFNIGYGRTMADANTITKLLTAVGVKVRIIEENED